MARNKLSVDFKGVDAYLDRLKALGGDAPKRAVEGALKQSQQYVARQAETAVKPHDIPVDIATHTGAFFTIHKLEA